MHSTPPGEALDAGRARADLASLADGGRPWQTVLGPVPREQKAGRQSAVLLLFSTVSGADVDLLFCRRSDDLRHHPGQVAFPGGGLDAGESTTQAALREAQEECAIDPIHADVLGPLAPVPLLISGNVVTPVLAWSDHRDALRPDGVETVAAFRVPVHDLIDPGKRGIVRVPRPGMATFDSPAFVAPEGLIWGFTAFVLDAVLDAVGWTVPWDQQRTLPLPRLV